MPAIDEAVIREMADLFDVPADGSNLRDDEDSDEAGWSGDRKYSSFDQTIGDVQSIIEPVPLEKPVPVEETKAMAPDSVDEIASVVKKSRERKTEKTVAAKSVSSQEVSPESKPKVSSPPPPVKGHDDDGEEGDGDGDDDESGNGDGNSTDEKPDAIDELIADTAIGLSQEEQSELAAIQKKYPWLELSCPSMGVRSFYRFKIRELIYITRKFPMLNVPSLMSEVKQLNVDHSFEALPDLDQIVSKMNKVIRSRHRLTEILSTVLEQFYLWERAREMLRGRLFIDKDVKGAHKRDGIPMEHMGDIEHYVSELQGLHEAGKRVDGFLVAAHESLSRMVACVSQEKKSEVVVRDNLDYPERPRYEKPPIREPDPADLEAVNGTDEIDVGEEITAPEKTNGPEEYDFGFAETDGFSDIG